MEQVGNCGLYHVQFTHNKTTRTLESRTLDLCNDISRNNTSKRQELVNNAFRINYKSKVNVRPTFLFIKSGTIRQPCSIHTNITFLNAII